MIVLNRIQVSLAHQTKLQDIPVRCNRCHYAKGVEVMDKRTGKKDKKKKQPKAEDSTVSMDKLPVITPKQSNIRQKK